MTCRPDCIVCARAGHLPEAARECLHRLTRHWTPKTFGSDAPFVVSMLIGAWVDGRIVGRAEEQERQRKDAADAG